MKEKNSIHAIELVRQIRDIQAAQMAGKSDAEMMEFFNAAGRLAQEKIGQTAKATVKDRRRKAA